MSQKNGDGVTATMLSHNDAAYSNKQVLPSLSNNPLSEKEHLEVMSQPLHERDSLTTPEGGIRAWLTVLGGAMIAFCTFGVVQSFGVYQDYYTRISLNEHTPSSISWIGSVQVFFVFAVGLPAGRLMDSGYFHHCILGGSLIYIFSIFMLSIVQPHHFYQNFLAQGVGMGIGMGLMFLPSLQVTSHYFTRRRSLAMGFVVSGSSIGGCLYPILLNNLFARKSGFGLGVRAVGFIDLGFLVIANLVMRTRIPPKRRRTEGGSVFKEVITDGPYLLFIFGSFLIFWGIFVPTFYVQLYAVLHSVSPVFVKYAITILNGASILGRTVPNFVADICGPVNVIIPTGIITGGLIFAMFGATSIGGTVAFVILYGFFSGGAVSVVTPAAVSFVSRKDHSDLGIRIGLLSFALAFALLTGSPVAGALLSPPKYKWSQPVIFSAVVTISGSVCILAARSALVKRKGTRIL